jgi:thiosulfate/3-mercaptopyruvate sulfurtransferase
MEALVTTEWLAAELGAPDLRVVDCTWFLPDEHRDARAEYDVAHIPGAVFLDLAALADADDPRPMMLPRPEQAADQLGALGLGGNDRLVLYDDSPHHTAARGWLALRSYGFDRVALLDGGLARWRAEGRPLTGDLPQPALAHATPRGFGHGIVTQAQVADALATGTAQVVDARSPTRFRGEEPEPRPGVEPGHMPGATNLHYARLFAADGTWLRGDALRAAFADAGIDPDRPIIATCGSGVTASVIAFAAHLLGHRADVYDGSWAEWGADPASPKARG